MNDVADIVAEIANLEFQANFVINSKKLSVVEKRKKIAKLLGSSAQVRRLLSLFLKRYRERVQDKKVDAETAENVVVELMESLEFRVLGMFLVSLFFFIVSGPNTIYPAFGAEDFCDLVLSSVSDEGEVLSL